MGFGQAIRSCFSKYATFSGRAPRSEYWYWVLFYVLTASACLVVGFVLAMIFGDWPEIIMALVAILVLATFLPYIAVSVRRLHDMDHTGWWFLLVLVPNIGSLILFIWFMFRGTVGDNRFGPDPFGIQTINADDKITHKSAIPTVDRKE